MNPENIGNFIKELRKEKNISQNQLSEEIHVTRQAISAWENGKAVPDSDILLILSTYFDVSINEILLGKRLSSDEGLEQITLQLIDDNNKKIKKIKKLIVSFAITLSIVLITFLGYYFINNYNSIKVYRIYGSSKNYKTHNGIFVITKRKVYLRLGKISQLNEEDNNKINNVKLYYKNNDKDIILFEENKTDILIDENYGYKEYFYNSNFDIIKENMYLEITYNDTEKDIIKLKIEEKFKNDFNQFDEEKLKVVKDKLNIERIRKKEELIEKLTEEAQTQVITDMTLRKKLDYDSDQSDSDNEREETQDENINYNYENQNNYQQETQDSSSQQNSYEEIIIEEQEEKDLNEEQNNQELDYEKIINIIKEKGTNQGGAYVYEFMKDDVIYSIIYMENELTIYRMQNNEIEDIQIYPEINVYYYRKYIDNVEIEFEKGNIYDNLYILSKVETVFEE